MPKSATFAGAAAKVHGPVSLEWMRATSYYFYGPNGNLLEFWSPKIWPPETETSVRVRP